MTTKNNQTMTLAQAKALILDAKKNALKQIAEKSVQIENLYQECINIADENEVNFSLCINDYRIQHNGNPANQWNSSNC